MNIKSEAVNNKSTNNKVINAVVTSKQSSATCLENKKSKEW